MNIWRNSSSISLKSSWSLKVSKRIFDFGLGESYSNFCFEIFYILDFRSALSMRRSHGGAEGRPGENLQCENDQMIKTPQTFLKSKNTFRSFQTNLKANIWWDPPNLFVKLIEILNALLHTFSYHFLGQH